MRLTEVFLSIPELLLVILLQAVLGKATPWSISLVLGLTGWTGIAKVVRTEVRRLRQSGYIVASRCMGGGFFRLLFGHLAPNFFSSILFMVVMNIRSAMVAESTLSFMGLRPAAGNHLLGQYAFPGGEGIAYRQLVDHPHPRCLSGPDPAEYHRPGP